MSAIGSTLKQRAFARDRRNICQGTTEMTTMMATAFSKDGNWLYVTNLELDLRTITRSPENPNGIQTVDSQWAAEVDRHSIARLKARIPPIQ